MSFTIISMDIFYRYVPNILLSPLSSKPSNTKNKNNKSNSLQSTLLARKRSRLEELETCRDTSGLGSLLLGTLSFAIENEFSRWCREGENYEFPPRTKRNNNYTRTNNRGAYNNNNNNNMIHNNNNNNNENHDNDDNISIWAWEHVWCVPATIWLMNAMEAIVSIIASKEVYLRLIQNPTLRIDAISQRESDRLLVGMESFTVCLWSNLLFFLAVYGMGQIRLLYHHCYENDYESLTPAQQEQQVHYCLTDSILLLTNTISRYWYSSLGGAFGSILGPGGGGGDFVFVGMWLGEIYAQELQLQKLRDYNIFNNNNNNSSSSSAATTTTTTTTTPAMAQSHHHFNTNNNNHTNNRTPISTTARTTTATTIFREIKDIIIEYLYFDVLSGTRPNNNDTRSKYNRQNEYNNNNNNDNDDLQNNTEFIICGCCQTTTFSSQETSASAPIASASCGHSICRSCVNSYHLSIMERTMTYEEWLPCPLCKASNAFCVTDLHVNFSLCTALGWIEQEQENNNNNNNNQKHNK